MPRITKAQKAIQEKVAALLTTELQRIGVAETLSASLNKYQAAVLRNGAVALICIPQTLHETLQAVPQGTDVATTFEAVRKIAILTIEEV